MRISACQAPVLEHGAAEDRPAGGSAVETVNCQCRQRYHAAPDAPVRASVGGAKTPTGRIAAHFDVTRQAVSQHLRVLHDAGLVSERRDGTRRIYRARPEGLAELRAFLDEFWSERLAALRREVETEHRRRIDDGDRKQ